MAQTVSKDTRGYSKAIVIICENPLETTTGTERRELHILVLVYRMMKLQVFRSIRPSKYSCTYANGQTRIWEKRLKEDFSIRREWRGDSEVPYEDFM